VIAGTYGDWPDRSLFPQVLCFQALVDFDAFALRLQAFAGLQVGAGTTRRKGRDHKMATGLGTARDNRTVIGVAADLPGWVEYLPR
jgi:hypothetical protein